MTPGVLFRAELASTKKHPVAGPRGDELIDYSIDDELIDYSIDYDWKISGAGPVAGQSFIFD